MTDERPRAGRAMWTAFKLLFVWVLGRPTLSGAGLCLASSFVLTALHYDDQSAVMFGVGMTELVYALADRWRAA